MESYYTDEKEFICLKCKLPVCDESNKGCLYRNSNGGSYYRKWYKNKKENDPVWYKKTQAKNRRAYEKKLKEARV